MDIILKISQELMCRQEQVAAAVKLIDEGCTIPFIARYRKEATGSLNDEQLRTLDERLTYLRGLEDRKEKVIASIEEQGMLTDELKKSILAAETLVAASDVYKRQQWKICIVLINQREKRVRQSHRAKVLPDLPTSSPFR